MVKVIRLDHGFITYLGAQHFGGAGNDRIEAGAGDDTIFGGLGRDRLTGNAGADSFVLDSAAGIANIDIITDFVLNTDRIVLDRDAFAALKGFAEGAVDADLFHIGNRATSSDHRLIFNSDNGFLYYDADGLGGAQQYAIARLENGAALTADDLFLI